MPPLQSNLGKLRALRLRKKIALADLGKHTGLSASMLSQLENGRLVPTLATLARIAMFSTSGSITYSELAAARRPSPWSAARAVVVTTPPRL